MRPIKLIMSAFGPYANEQEIDFDKLGKSGLYLITGETGAGKTTIFDAIKYALYGEASGSNRETSMLRSKYANDSTPTEVELTFLNGGKKYIIKRNPEYERKKLRGDGFTQQTAGAELILPDGKVETNIKRVNELIIEILGIDNNQFSQIAMIAQGDFLKLLFADTSDRQKIFRNIFKTDIYQIFQEKVKKDFNEINNSRENAKRYVEQYITSIVCSDNSEFYYDIEKAKNGEMLMLDTVDLINKILNEDEEKEKVLSKKIDNIENEIKTLTEIISKAEEQNKARLSLEKAKNNLLQEEPKLVQLKELLEIEKQKEPETQKLEKNITIIEEQLKDYDEFDKLGIKIKDNSKKLNECKVSEKENEEKISEYKDNIISYKNEIVSLENASENKLKYHTQFEKLTEKENEISEFVKDLSNLEKLEKDYKDAQKDYSISSELVIKHNEKAERMRLAFNNEQAGIMAENLADGEPCPVCGSCNHPNKAIKSEKAPSEAEVKKAEEDAKKVQLKSNEKSLNCNEKKVLYDTSKKSLEAKLEKLFAFGNIENANENIHKELENLRLEKQALQLKIDEEDKKIKRKKQLSECVENTESKINLANELLSKLKSEISSYSTSISEQSEQQEKLLLKLKFESKESALLKKQEYEKQIFQNREELNKAKYNYDLCEKSISEFKAQIVQLNQILENAQVIDIEVKKQEQLTYNEEKAKLTKHSNTVIQRRINNSNALKNIEIKSVELASLDKKWEMLKSLSDTTGGTSNGKQKITLETYVQTAFFDKIIGRANVHLMKMSGNKYDLKRKYISDNMRGKSGLELNVIDHYNGTERSVKSLSGGESFIASLSLALGLSEEIQATAGGIKMDAMFVDEGFGSLDEDTLRQAMQALSSLSENNRLVGIISHVGELRSEIDKQIVVSKEKSGGSRAEIRLN